MATFVRLYAWAVPAFTAGSPVDHTWVTSYDNRSASFGSLGQVTAAKQFYWLCWGNFHPKGRFLGEGEGDSVYARCLVEPNADSRKVVAARGTILRYGRDGVCHQLANQVLYSIGGDDIEPVTVADARGYILSSFRYGTYGLNDDVWKDKRNSCGTRGKQSRRHRRSGQMTQKPDDFEIRARKALKGQSRTLLPKLRALRTQAQGLSSRQWSKSYPPSAEEINTSNQEMFDRAAELLGPENFKRIFGAAAYEEVDLVDPQFLSQSDTEADLPMKTNTGAIAGSRISSAATTVTLKHLAASLAADNELSKKQAEAILGGFVGNIVKHLKKGQRIRIGGLGILQVRKRAARMGRNPTTGEAIQIKSSKKVAFRASKELKEAI